MYEEFSYQEYALEQYLPAGGCPRFAAAAPDAER
jgi:hypothetical protein